MADCSAQKATLQSLVDICQRGVACGSDVEELFRLLEELFDLDAIALGADLRRPLRVRQRGQTSDHSWRGVLEPARDIFTHVPIGTWYVHEQSAAVAEIAGVRNQRLRLALLGARQGFDASAIWLLRLLYPHLSFALRGHAAHDAIIADPDERLEHVLARAQAHATITLSDARIQWSSNACHVLEQRLGATRARLEALLLRAAATAEDCTLPGNLRLSFVRPPVPAGELIAIFDDWKWSASSSQKALHLAEELLSPRQRQIARLIAGGASLGQVAATLRIQHETARAHLAAAYDRLAVRDRARLALLLAGATLE